MKEILIKKHESLLPLEYPVKCLPPELFSDKSRNGNDDLIEWSEVEAYRKNELGVSHVEALKIPERYVRGIVTHEGQEYVFTARIDLMTTMNKLDMTKLLEEVTGRIKGGSIA